jgi:hypothetical protein
MITRVPPFWRDECTTVIPWTAAFQGNQFRGAFTVVHTSGTQNFADCISMNGKQKAPPLVPTDRANQCQKTFLRLIIKFAASPWLSNNICL